MMLTSRSGTILAAVGAAFIIAAVGCTENDGVELVEKRPRCGDGICRGKERCSICPDDCGVCPGADVCGDGMCSSGEDCMSCAEDCGGCAACGDGTCDASEDCINCAADCGTCPAQCGDGSCDPGEDCASCAADCGACPPTCGDGTCEAGEDCASCAADCGVCGPTCDPAATSFDGHHNEGMPCLLCHNGAVAPRWTVAGTLYNGLAGTPVAGGTITVLDATGREVKLVTATNGNFWTTTNLAMPVTVRASKCPSLMSMSSQATGDCNGCHSSGFRVFVP